MGIAYTLDAPSRNIYTCSLASVGLNAKQHTKFLFPRLISFGDIEGYQNKNVRLLSPQTQRKILYGTIVLVNAYKYIKFQFPSCITLLLKIRWGLQNKNWELMIFSNAS